MRRIKLPQLGLVIAVCAVAGAVAGIAGSAAAPSKKKSPAAAAAKRAAIARHAGGFFGFRGPGVHSESVVLNKAGDGFITVTSDAGKVKSISGNEVTIDESIGNVHYKDVTVTIPDDATVYRNHAKAAVSDLKADDNIRVVASSEATFVVAETDAFEQQERQRFRDGGPFGHGRGPGGPGAPLPYGP
jgi:hypothetical protein